VLISRLIMSTVVITTTALAGAVPANAAGTSTRPTTSTRPAETAQAARQGCLARIEKTHTSGTATQPQHLCSWTETATQPSPAQISKQRAALQRLDASGPTPKTITPHTLRPAGVGIQSVREECLSRASEQWVIARTEACGHRYLHNVIYNANPPYNEIGHVTYDVVLYIFSLGESWAFEATFTNIDQGGDLTGTIFTGSFGCTGSCFELSAEFINTPVDASPVITAKAIYTSRITGPMQWGYATSSITLDMERPNTIPDPSERFFVDGHAFPAAAEHITASQNSGAPGRNIELHRVTGDRIDQNRNTSCPSPFPRPLGMQCDEYPFASTYEGAFSAPKSGKTFPWCQVSWLPQVNKASWSACMIPGGEIEEVGRELNEFYRDWRIIQGDPFFVEVV
jgi:hypothetical protein